MFLGNIGTTRRLQTVVEEQSWLHTPGVHSLPSGREVLVGAVEEDWLTIELAEGVRLVVDADGPDQVFLSLHRARGEYDGVPATRPYGSEATVAVEHGWLVVRDLPASVHQLTCADCPLDERSQFAVSASVGQVTSYLEALIGLPVDPQPWIVPAGGAQVWRGSVDQQGRAVIELLAEDERRWHAPAVVGHLDVGWGESG